MKKIFFSINFILLILFLGINESSAAVCTPVCKTNEFCQDFTIEGVGSSGNAVGECVPKLANGLVCYQNQAFSCVSGICKNGICAAPEESTNPEQQTYNAVEKALSNLPSELNFAEAQNDPYLIVGGIIKVFLGIIGTFALLIFLYGGIMWMIAGGNEQAVVKAQKTLIWAALGLFVVFLSYTTVNYLINAFKF